MLLKNAQVLNDAFEWIEADLRINGETIGEIAPGHDLAPKEGEQVFDLAGCWVLPGFIDQHIHGCGGAGTEDGTIEALDTMSRYLARQGVTSFCPTTMTLPEEKIASILSTARQAMEQGLAGAYVQGVNMEGPYISPGKKGAQNGDYVRNPDPEEFERLFAGCGGIIKLVDIAPEQPGAQQFIEQVKGMCAVPLHLPTAPYEQAPASFAQGISQATHLFNAMTGFTHRAPGAVGAVFDHPSVKAELICDGFHIHPAALRTAFRLLGEDRTIIVSDSMTAAGCPDGAYDLGGQTVFVKEGKALLEDGTIAASTTNIGQEVRNLLAFGVPFRQVLKSATINPARQLGVDHITGSIKIGKYADLTVTDKNCNPMQVFVKGRPVEM